MSTSAPDIVRPTATSVSVSDTTIDVELCDGRSLSVPNSWYPRLAHANQKEKAHWALIGPGLGIHWPDLDEDISVEALIAGIPSNEGQASLAKWLESRDS